MNDTINDRSHTEMMDRLKIVPRAAVPASSGRGMINRLPDELVEQQVQRIAVFSAVIGGLWLIGLSMDAFIVPLLLGFPRPPMNILLEVTGVAVSALMYLYVRRTTPSCQTRATAGLFFMIATSVGVALLNVLSVRDHLLQGPHVSWNAVLILVFSMIAPVAPTRLLIASLVAASMDPLLTWIVWVRGFPALPPMTALLHYLPNYTCAFVAMVPSHVLQHLGRRLREAQELGSYQLVERLGQGGMGEVWRGQHRLLVRDVAIKLVRPEVLGGSEADARSILLRFEREAKATARLTSQHTINVFDFGITNEGSFYYVMELLSGRDLESFVREFGPLTAQRTTFLFRQVCHSLADAHARGMIHRDIKPANIYLCRMGLEYDFVKVLDFGLVKYRSGAVQQTLATLSHQTTGTPAYMAPEIILGEAEVDRRADIYSLGCVVYYLLTGQLVFEAETPMKMLMQHVHDEPVSPSARSELPVPQTLDTIVLACLQKDPEKRPKDVEEILRLLDQCEACEGWNQQLARTWWEQHLPELTGPLLMSDFAEPLVSATARSVAKTS